MLHAKLEGVWKDIDYLTRMEQLENPDNHDPTQGNFHIVPISGLVVSKLSRFQNEVHPHSRPIIDRESMYLTLIS